MAPGIGEKGGPIRVFVLEDKGAARGVFLSWDAAEAYADEHGLSLEHLHEFITQPSHPEHLHLLAAEWDSGWVFQGEWKKEIPKWQTPPKQVRLDHYHLRGNSFLIFRQKEFIWSTGLLLKIDPMAPDSVLDRFGVEQPVVAPKPSQQWRPKLGALKSPTPVPSLVKPEAEPEQTTPILPAEKPSPSLPKPSLDLSRPAGAQVGPSDNPPASPSAASSARRLSLREAARAAEQRKRKPLKLRSKGTPQPIPDFEPVAPIPALPSTVSSVELAHMDQSGVAIVEGTVDGEPESKRVSMRLLIALAAFVVGWGGGIFWVFRPQPTAEEIVTTIATLNPAEILTIEPGQIFFQLPVDPIHQQRWVRSLNLNPIPRDSSLPIPTLHALSTWSEPDKFIRPPYADIEVREWWDLRLRNVTYGFTMEWEDGSILILDLESDMLIGWTRADHLPGVLN